MVRIKNAPKHVISLIDGFVQFLQQQNVVGLTVGIVMGSAAKNVVDSMVSDFFNPIIGLLLGGVALADKSVCLSTINGVCKNKIAWGHFVTVLIQFVVVSAIVYFVIIKTIELIKMTKENSGK